MLPRHAFLPAALILALLTWIPSISRAQSGAGGIDWPDWPDAAFTLDIPIQSDIRGDVVGILQKHGVPLIGASINEDGVPLIGASIKEDGVSLIRAPIQGDGRPPWTHILVGLFGSAESAARYGHWLIARGFIERFVIKGTLDARGLTRPRRVAPTQQYNSPYDSGAANSSGKSIFSGRQSRSGNTSNVAAGYVASVPAVITPGWRPDTILALAPGLDPGLIPRPDPILMALNDLTPRKSRQEGGLWLAGDVGWAVSRLEWIVGQENSSVISVQSDGRVRLDTAALLRLSRADRVRAGADLLVADYIRSNEGLYLVTQLVRAANRYCLYVGERLPTAGGKVRLPGSINLDNNFDRRINPYRKDGMKLPQECPPYGFDAITGINPTAVWFNIESRRLVPDGMIAFHELAEALAKIAYGLEYLPVGSRPGAHNTAVQRELRLRSQRPNGGVITTAGSNRVFGNEKGFLEFKAELHASRAGR